MNQHIYINIKVLLLGGGLDLETDTLKLAILDSGHSIDLTGHNYWSDVSGDEIAASGSYTTGGVALAGKAIIKDTANIEGVLDCNGVVLTGFSASNMQYLVIYKSTGVAGTSPLIAIADLESPVNYTNQTVRIAIHADGLIRVL